MGRIFSISFNYQQQYHNALVTACPAANVNTRYIVTPENDELKSLLPGGKIGFNNLDELQQIAQGKPRLQELLFAIASALNQKLEPTSG